MNPSQFVKHLTRAFWVAIAVFTAAPTTAGAAIAPAHIGFSSPTVGFNATNFRTSGTSEFARVEFFAADGSVDTTVPVTLSSSDITRVAVAQVPANALGNYSLTVPANAQAGSATVTASAVVNGVTYARSRVFVIAAAPVVPPAPVPGTSTMVRATTPTLAADQSGCSAVTYYDVGPGRAYTALGQLPWSQLRGCDTVRIYAKPNGGSYNEMMLISAGTNMAPSAPNKFMRVLGVADPVTGALPIIDGTNATQLETLPGQAPRSLQYHDNGNAGNRALYKLGLIMVGPQLGYNYHAGPAGYIAIENLDIRNLAYNAPFSDALTGTTAGYHSFGSCLYVEAAAHLVVKGNVLHNCGNGLFMNSKNGGLTELSQDILIEGNSFFNNGNPPTPGVTNGYLEHNSYTEARDITFQFNTFGDMRPGAMGDCLKDRSSGLVVRYNTFTSNCGIALHLMDSTGGQALIWGDPAYSKTYVYGNLFDSTPVPTRAVTLLNYGGDSGAVANYRKGTFHFYNNTVVTRGDAANGIYPEVFLFNLNDASAVAESTNNVFHALPATAGKAGKVQVMAFGRGTVNMANNWVSPNAAQFWVGHYIGAVVNGWNSNLGANNQPLMVAPLQHDFRPALGSPLINAGNGLGALPTAMLPIAQPGGLARKQDGALDIGAYEY